MSAASKAVIDEAVTTLAEMLTVHGAIVETAEDGNPTIEIDQGLVIPLRPIAATVAIAAIGAFLAQPAAQENWS